MKLTEKEFEDIKHSLIISSDYRGAMLSLNIPEEKREEDLEEIKNTIKSATYTFGILGFSKKYRVYDLFLGGGIIERDKFYGLGIIAIDKVELEFYEKTGLVNIFIHGPNADEIGLKVEEFAKGLEDRT